MNASLIDVAIVLIGIFIALALAASWLQEQIAALTHLRGAQLYRGILNLVANSKSLADAVYTHQLVTASVDKAENDTRPSYLDARNFSLALWQSVHKTVGSEAGDAAANVIALPHELLGSLEARVSGLNDSDALKAPLAALIAAGGDYEKLLRATDAWFDSQMDRVSGWYKRTTQWWLVGIGALIVIGGGIDTISIAKQAYISPIVTSALAGGIEKSLRSDAANVPAPGGSPSPHDRAQAVAEAVNTALAKEPTIRVLWSSAMLPTDAGGWALKALGLLITVVAVSLGAPFWFDLLKCLINVRMAGEKPQATEKKT